MTSLAFILIGGILCFLLVRLVGGGRSLLIILLASYSLRVALTLGLYLVSAYEIPLFQSLHLPGGFWRFTYDAPSYHVNGARIAEALRGGAELPQIMVGNQPFLVDNYDFFYFVGLVYWAFGTHPLHVPLLNAMFWTTIAFLGYELARRIKGESAARLAAALISFWPSGIIWSSQILKDSVVILLLLFSLYLVIQIWEEKGRVALPAAIVLMPAFFLLVRIRFSLGAVLILAVIASIGLTMVMRFRELRWRNAIRALALMILLWVPALVAQSADPSYALFLVRSRSVATSPTNPTKASSETSAQSKPTLLQPTLNIVVETARRSFNSARQTYSFASIDIRRRGYAGTGGASNVAADVQFRNVWDMIIFLPRGLAYALYGPFPWDWFSLAGDTGVFKAFAGVEALLMIAATPFLLVGGLTAVRSKRMDAWTLLIFGSITIAFMALTVTNLGTLFRLRLNGLTPLLILVSAFGIPTDRMGRLLARHHFLCRRPSRPNAPSPSTISRGEF